MSRSTRTILLHYSGAVVFTALAVLLRWLLDPWLGDQLPLPTFYGAVALTVWRGGYRPALLAVVLSYLASDWFFIDPRGQIGVASFLDAVGLVRYLVSCAVIIGLGEAVRQARWRAEAHRVRLQEEAARRQKAEEEARDAQRHAAIVLASITDAFYTLDRAWRFSTLNTHAEQLLGRPRAELLGRAVWEVLPEETRSLFEEHFHKAVATGASVHFEVPLPRTQRWSEVRAYPSAQGLSVFCRDISDRKEAEWEVCRLNQELQGRVAELNTLLDILPVGVWQADAACERVLGNRTAYDMLGLPQGINASLTARHDPLAGVRCMVDGRELRPDELPLQRAARTGQVVRNFEHDVVFADGTVKTVYCNVAPLRDADGRVRGVVGMYADLTERKRAEAELRAITQQLQLVTESMAAAVTRCSRDLRYLWVSKPYADWIGRPVQAIVGQPILDILGPEAFRHLQPYFERVLAGEVVRYEEPVPFQGLGPRWISAVYTPTRDAHGECDGWVAVVLDIDQRKQAEAALRASEARFRQLAEAMPQIVWVADPSGRNVYLNRHWQDFTGRTVEEGLDERWVESIHPDDRPGLTARWEACVRDGTPYTAEYRLRGKDGAYRWQVVRGVPIKDAAGRVVCWYGSSTDIDEPKRLAEALQEADQRKDDFLATLAHELRNPLAPIRNAVRILRAKGPSDPDLTWSRDVIDRQVGQMARLLDDLLDVSRITRNKLELRRSRVALASVVDTALETSRPLIEASHHTLTVTLPAEPVLLDADPIRLAQVLANLLNNSAKYTEEGGQIRLSAARQGHEVVIAVEDTGIGIAPETLPHIFEMFSQAKPALERSQGGLGIGLSLVKGLVEMHGGSIRAESAGVGKGSRFVVRLPVALPVSATVSPPAEAEPSRVQQLRIVVADDNRDTADSLAFLLQLSGHEVRTTYDGQEAVDAARALRPHVMLLDIGMPRLNGYEAARRIRQEPWGKGVMLIALTGWGQEEDRRQSAEAGFDAHLVKPVDPATIETLLERLTPQPGA